MSRTLIWTGTADTDFANPLNWNDVTNGLSPAASPPGAGDVAQFAGAGGSMIATDGAVLTAGTLDLGDGSGSVLVLGNNAEIVSNTVNIGSGNLIASLGGVIDPVTINNKGKVGGSGTADANINNTGTIYAQKGTYEVTGAITGTGVLEIDNTGNLQVDGAVSGQTVSFADNTGILTIEQAGSFSATVINGFQVGDEIILPNVTFANQSFDAGTDTLTLTDSKGGPIATLVFSGTHAASDFASSVIACFVAGTCIATEDGEKPVEQLRAGDRLCVLGGDAKPIVWIGRRHVDCRHHPTPHQVWPVQVKAGALGPGRPHRDLWLSPDHALFLLDGLTPVKYLINGSSIAQIPVDEVTYFHIQVPGHEVLLAEQLPVESYLDVGDKSSFANGEGTVSLYPDFASRVWEADGCAPLIVAGPRLAAVRRWVDTLAFVAARSERAVPQSVSANRLRRGRRRPPQWPVAARA